MDRLAVLGQAMACTRRNWLVCAAATLLVLQGTGVRCAAAIPPGEGQLPLGNNHIFMVAANLTPTADLQGALALCGVEAAGRVAARVGAWAKVLTTDPENWNRAYSVLGAGVPVFFEELNLPFQVAGTPLEQWYGDGSWLSSHPSPYRALSHVLRALLLYKWGGVFVDFDALLLDESLLDEGGDAFVALQDELYVNDHVVRFPRYHPLAREWVEALARSCRINKGAAATHEDEAACDRQALHGLYREQCAVHSSTSCVGVQLLQPEVTTPLGWDKMEHAFSGSKGDVFGDKMTKGMAVVHWYYKASLGADWAARPACIQHHSFMEDAMRTACRKTVRLLEHIIFCDHQHNKTAQHRPQQHEQHQGQSGESNSSGAGGQEGRASLSEAKVDNAKAALSRLKHRRRRVISLNG